MSQQTTLAFLIPKFKTFVETLPDVFALASCSDETLRSLWAGLGYYARARNLQKAARLIAFERGGEFPSTAEGWREIPGCGPYTAAAIASVCFGDKVACVDGNVIRVVSRLCGLEAEAWTREGQAIIQGFVTKFVPACSPGNFNQAMMELGATVCKKQNPDCGGCPISKGCRAFAESRVAQCPAPKPRKAMVQEELCSFIFVNRCESKVAVANRASGFLKGTTGFPVLRRSEAQEAARHLQKLPGIELCEVDETFTHTITHHKITARIVVVKAKSDTAKQHEFASSTKTILTAASWHSPAECLLENALSTSFDKKAWQTVLRQKGLLFP